MGWLRFSLGYLCPIPIKENQAPRPISKLVYAQSSPSYTSVLRAYIRNAQFNTSPIDGSHVQEALICSKTDHHIENGSSEHHKGYRPSKQRFKHAYEPSKNIDLKISISLLRLQQQFLRQIIKEWEKLKRMSCERDESP
jgi:hypothetical protein